MAKKRVHRPEGSRPIPPPTAPPAAGRVQASAGTGRSLRDRFEGASRPILLLMQGLPSFVLPVVMGILLFLGLTLNATWSGILLAVVAVFLVWLTAVSWPVITTGSRILRVAVDVGILALGVLKLLGRI